MGFQLGLFSWEGFLSHTGSSQREGWGCSTLVSLHGVFSPIFSHFLHIFLRIAVKGSVPCTIFALSFYTQLFCLSFSLVFPSTLVS